MTSSDSDLEAQIKEMRDLAALTRGFFGVHPQSGADHLEEIADRIQAHLDRDRKMKAELAEMKRDWEFALDHEQDEVGRISQQRVISILGVVIAKLEADSKTEASE